MGSFSPPSLYPPPYVVDSSLSPWLDSASYAVDLLSPPSFAPPPYTVDLLSSPSSDILSYAVDPSSPTSLGPPRYSLDLLPLTQKFPSDNEWILPLSSWDELDQLIQKRKRYEDKIKLFPATRNAIRGIVTPCYDGWPSYQLLRLAGIVMLPRAIFEDTIGQPYYAAQIARASSQIEQARKERANHIRGLSST